MDAFETAVAQALTPALHVPGSGIDGLSRARFAADRIAPRVAAAIEAAGLADEREEPTDPGGYQTKALAALRGEPR